MPLAVSDTQSERSQRIMRKRPSQMESLAPAPGRGARTTAVPARGAVLALQTAKQATRLQPFNRSARPPPIPPAGWSVATGKVAIFGPSGQPAIQRSAGAREEP